ncbi:hypothetical protein G3567_05645 [Psychroflexus sp. YR1-1]|uniref:Lipoprotein n=1 Tax=Psychroflexus aurantiacus TaxID=2709310 RepID=A0A6B3QZG4_9FLAO|nr:hypothetical protein [Psychroflexus aurantiacus]NEV93636.1 hypothetical protein [Psychroflexus aurantiacus]
MKTFLYVLISLASSASCFSQIWLDNSCPIEKKVSIEEYTSAKSNNLLSLIIDQEGKLVMNGKRKEGMSEIDFKESVYDFLTNPAKDKTKADSPKQAIIAIGSYGEHNSYELILKYLREVYLYAWDTAAEEKYEAIYLDLDCRKREKIRDSDFPYRLLELNDSEKENKMKNRFTPGVPPFPGDIKDN